MKTFRKPVSRLLLTSVIVSLLTITLHIEDNVVLARQDTQSKVDEHSVTDYIWVSIRQFMVLSELGNTSTIIEQTVSPTRLEVIYTEPIGQRTYGIIKASSVYGYSSNQGFGPGPITTSGAWMMRWVVTGRINLDDCSMSLKIYEYFIPGLEVGCAPFVGCEIGATLRENVGYYLIEFEPNKGFGYEVLTLPPIVPGSNSRIEATVRMERVPVSAPTTQLSQEEYQSLYTPPCSGLDPSGGVLKINLPRLHVIPPHMDEN